MASNRQTIFNGPKNFITTERGPDGKYLPALNREALDELKQVEHKLVVISAVGAYRTGKSYLLNRMSQKVLGPKFAVGHLSQPETKGLWLMIIDHPVLTDHKLALLDTEGIGDVKKGDVQHDAMLFILTCLLSDTMIYNALNAIDEAAVEKLNFTAEMSNYLVSKTKKEGDDENFHKFFPELVYVVRDFHLRLEENGREITPDEYLENALAVGSSDDTTASRAKTRNSIKKYFPRRKCFTLDIPAAGREVLLELDTVADDQLNKDFLKTMNELLRYVVYESKSRTLQDGRKINGRQVAMLVETYVNAYRQKDVPNISSAMENLKAQENRKALEKAESIYKSRMDFLKDTMPTESMDDVETEHKNMLKLIRERIHEDAILEGNELEGFVREIQERLNVTKEFYIQENKRLSKKKCDDTLKAFFRQIQSKRANEYSRPGGYQEYRTDMANLKQKYKGKTGLGVMKEQILLEFMEEKRAEEDSILAMDNTLTEKEKEVIEQRRKAEQAEVENRRREMLRQEAERNAKLLEEKLEQNERMMDTMKQRIESEQRARMRMEEKYEEFKIEQARLREQSQEYQRLVTNFMEQRREESEEAARMNALGGIANLAATVGSMTLGLLLDDSD